jgi:hypothetical protein
VGGRGRRGAGGLLQFRWLRSCQASRRTAPILGRGPTAVSRGTQQAPRAPPPAPGRGRRPFVNSPRWPARPAPPLHSGPLDEQRRRDEHDPSHHVGPGHDPRRGQGRGGGRRALATVTGTATTLRPIPVQWRRLSRSPRPRAAVTATKIGDAAPTMPALRAAVCFSPRARRGPARRRRRGPGARARAAARPTGRATTRGVGQERAGTWPARNTITRTRSAYARRRLIRRFGPVAPGGGQGRGASREARLLLLFLGRLLLRHRLTSPRARVASPACYERRLPVSSQKSKIWGAAVATNTGCGVQGPADRFDLPGGAR